MFSVYILWWFCPACIYIYRGGGEIGGIKKMIVGYMRSEFSCIFNEAVKLFEITVEYCQSAPPIFTLGWQERGGADKR